jgi:hypothetical protein
MPYFDQFDICEAYAVLESDYNVGGVLLERPSNYRRAMSTAYQLCRMKFKSRPNLSYDSLTPNGKAIYQQFVIAHNL